MYVSTPFLGLGLTLTGLGMIMVVYSFMQGGGPKSEPRARDATYIGPILVGIRGKNKWVVIGFIMIAILSLLILFSRVLSLIAGW
jgi:hypothetical protein